MNLPTRPPIKTVLIATDLSDPSLPAIDAGMQLAKAFDAKVVLGYVVEDHMPPVGLIEVSGYSYEAITEQHRERAEARLREYAKAAAGEGLEVDVDVARGVAHAELVEMSKRHLADVLVMSTHGRGFISHALLGSTTERVLRRAECPVYVIRDPRED